MPGQLQAQGLGRRGGSTGIREHMSPKSDGSGFESQLWLECTCLSVVCHQQSCSVQVG
jgi:hypothetical protein